MSNYGRARRNATSADFGRRHPRLTAAIGLVLFLGMLALVCSQIVHGTYLGASWIVSVAAGLAGALALTAALVVTIRRKVRWPGPARVAATVLALGSLGGFRYPFPVGPYDSVQAFFNVVHAVSLGFSVPVVLGIAVVMLYALIVKRRAPQQATVTQDAVFPARLRFPEIAGAKWQKGALVVADGQVAWVAMGGHALVDLTAACQTPFAESGGRSRRTTLPTAEGRAEIDLSPKRLADLTGSARILGSASREQ